MAKCIKCGTDIPDGSEYCEECLSKLNTAKDSESYLDSLLNAVMTDEQKTREIVFSNKRASSLVSAPKEKKSTVKEETLVESPGVREETLEESTVVQEEVPAILEEKPEENMEPEWSAENAFDSFFTVDGELPNLKNYSIFEDVDEDTIDRMLEKDLDETAEWDATSFSDMEEPIQEIEEQPEEDNTETEFPEAFSKSVPEDTSMMFDDAEETPEEEMIFDAAKEKPEDAVSGDGLDDFAGLLGNTDENAAPEMSASEIDEFADLFAGLDGGADGLFDFGAEPIDLDALPEEAQNATVPVMDEHKQEERESEPQKPEKKEKKTGRFAALYHKLFDNVKVDPSKQKPQPTKEEIEAKKKAKQEAKERSKEEKEALLAEKKEQEKQAKQEKQRLAREAKTEKKARKLEEAKLLLEEMEKTRINRAGASIVFIFFAMIAVVIVVGTSIFSYSLSIRNAEYEFNRDEYTLAYNEIYGLDIKDEDILLYDRIMTVMYVQKQLNSYYNYYGMNDKPKALDSLLKGLQRYEKYIELAVELDVDSDLDSVRKKILTEVSDVFGLSEQEAMEIIQSDTQAEYSKKVYDAIDKMQE